MSAKKMSSVNDETRDLRKQMGCMNGIFQIFDRHHFHTERRLSGHRHKRLLQGATAPQYTTITKEKALTEVKKEKPRNSTESSRPSYSSSSCSSTFSSLDSNRIAQPETLTQRKNQTPFPFTPTKAVVKNSMHREARGISIKPLSKDDRRGTTMKHIDSPRPSSQQPIISKESTRVLGRAQEAARNSSKDEHVALPRLSYDGRESRDVHKWAAKHKELSRLSLDSKVCPMKSRLDFLPPMENESPRCNRTSSIVTKLMGLENFPDTNSLCPKETFVSPSPRFHNDTFVRKSNTCSRFPVEGCPKIDAQGRKAPTNNHNLSPSVYGEIEKRITELQFQKSGKDLRALKQIIEGKQKTREKFEERTGGSNISTWKNNRSRHRFSSMEGTCMSKPLGSSVIIKPSKVLKKQGLQNSKDAASKDNKKIENVSRAEGSFGMVSPRLNQNLLRIGQPRPTTPSSDSDRDKKNCSRKVVEKGLKNRKNKVRGKDQNSVTRTREHMPAVEINVIVSEQPSPISVLDDTFYCEDSPSPIKKISTAFQDESPSTDEAELHLENLYHSTDIAKSNHARKLENFQNSIQELTMSTEPDKTDADHRYINKILLTSGLLKDSSSIQTTDQFLSSCHLINPDMFHVLEQTEGLNGEVSGKNDRMQSHKKAQRKIIFDMVDEILVQKVNSGRLCTSVGKKTSPQGLLKEVFLEMDRACSVPKECNLDDEGDQISRLLSADMMCEDDWKCYSGEVPALVLDIERLIFKDLIKEVITGDYEWPPRHCRNQFSK